MVSSKKQDAAWVEGVAWGVYFIALAWGVAFVIAALRDQPSVDGAGLDLLAAIAGFVLAVAVRPR